MTDSKTARATASKAAAKATATKAAKAAKAPAAKAPAAKAAEMFTVYGIVAGGHSPYKAIGADTKTKSAYTIAALVASGFARIDDAGILVKGNGKARHSMLKGLVGSGPVAHHTKNGNLAANGMTAKGQVWFSNRMIEGNPTWNSRGADVVRAIADGMTSGGKLALDLGEAKREFNFEFANSEMA